jgi:glycosyltransferase involved in cell wall biosynthesis
VPSEIRSRVLFIEDRVPSLRLGAGFGRSEIIVRKLLEMSDLDIFACDAESSDLAPDDFRCISVTYGPDPAPLQKLLSSRHYDAVYVCRPHNLARYVDVLRAWKQNGGKIVYDTEAIFAVREVSQMERAESYAEITASPQFAAEADKELQWAELADVIIAVNDLEATILRQRLSRPVFIVGHYLPARLLQPRPRDRSGLLFVGALHDSRSPNYDSLLWFLDRVWPRIRAVRPDETLRIAGFVGPGVAVDALRQDGVACLGALTELTSEYAHARVSIAPTRFAAGIPFKVHEALSYGLPAVVSQLIDEQLSHTTEYDNPVLAATVNDDGKMFYEACLQLLTDDELWLRKHKAALAFVIRFCAPGLLTDTIDALLHEIGADATGSRPSGLGCGGRLRFGGQVDRIVPGHPGAARDLRIVQVSPTTYSRASVIGGGEKLVLYTDYALRLAGSVCKLPVITSVLSFGDQAGTAYSDHNVLYEPVSGRPWDVLSIDVDALRSALRGADIVYIDQCLCAVGVFVAAHARLLGCRVIGRDSGAGEYPFLDANPEIGRLFDAFHAQSTFAAAGFSAFEVPVHVIPGPINTDIFVPPAVPRRDLSQVLAVGRIMPHKGFDRTIRALPSELALTIVGQPYDEPYLAFLKNLAIDKQVTFKTNVGDSGLRALFQKAGLFVHASTHSDYRGNFSPKPELLGLAPLEALSSGLPAIVSNAGSLPELSDLPGCFCFQNEHELEEMMAAHAAGALPRFDEAEMHAAVETGHGPLSTGEKLLQVMGLI